MKHFGPFDVPITIPYSTVVLEKARYAIQTLLPDTDFQGTLSSDVVDIASYMEWIHHGTYVRHTITRYVDLNQWVLYPSLPAVDEHEVRYVHKCNWTVR